MSEAVLLRVNGREIWAPVGSTVAVAIALAGNICRRSVTGEPRAPLCGMGICFECRASIDGQLHSRTCQVVCRSGMDVRTDG